MRGHRVETREALFDAGPGAYMKGTVTFEDESFVSFVAWWFTCPGCGGQGGLSYDPRRGAVHEVDEHEDGTISVQPKPSNSNSILHSCGWHGYIDHDEWLSI